MKYKCLIVEDNILERDALEMNLRKIDSLSVQAALADGMQAVSYLKDHVIDIVFSDIDMPDLSGIELLKSIKYPPVFVFISGHSEHAAESFELDVIDYIVKPAKMERLIKAADKAIEYIQAKKKLQQEFGKTAQSAPPVSSGDFVRTIDADEHFFIKEKNAYVKINMSDVLYIESMGDFSRIMTTSQKSHFILVSLKNLEKQLPEKMFMRIHKQFIVSLLHLSNISTTDVKLSGNITIPLSSAYRQHLLDNVVAKKTLTRFGE